MPGKRSGRRPSGRTDKGHVRDVKVERIGGVTIYQRGSTYYLYYREGGKSVRRKVDGNLATARATAGKIVSSLAEERPSLFNYQRTSPQKLVDDFLASAADVKRLSLRTCDRYRAALSRFREFCEHAEIRSLEAIQQSHVEDFVRWLRGKTRARNGSASKRSKKQPYKVNGIKFILSTCRTAFNYALKRRMLPPYAENPFSCFPIEQLRDERETDDALRLFSAEQEKAFFDCCNDWQRDIFLMLASYGMRVGELTHLLIEDVDLQSGTLTITSKPELFWSVKTRQRRQLPITPATDLILRRHIGTRSAGFVFLEHDYWNGTKSPVRVFSDPSSFRRHLTKLVAKLASIKPDVTDRDKHHAVVRYCRRLGQIQTKRIREEFCRLTTAIGCPEFTRAHDLRHLFASRAIEAGVDSLMVQEILGHTTLLMTKRYTHLAMKAKRDKLAGAMSNLGGGDVGGRHEGTDR